MLQVKLIAKDAAKVVTMPKALGENLNVEKWRY